MSDVDRMIEKRAKRSPGFEAKVSRATLVWTAIAFSNPLCQHEASPQPFPQSQLRSPSCSPGRTPAWTPAKPPSGAIVFTTIRCGFQDSRRGEAHATGIDRDQSRETMTAPAMKATTHHE